MTLTPVVDPAAGGARNLKSMRPPSEAVFYDLFLQGLGALTSLSPSPGSTTEPWNEFDHLSKLKGNTNMLTQN